MTLDYGRLKQNVADGYQANAFFVKVIKELGGKILAGIPFDKYGGEALDYVEQSGNRLLAAVTQERDSFSRFLRAVQQQWDKASRSLALWLENRWESSSSRPGRLTEKLKDMFKDIAQEYDNIVRGLQLRLEEMF